MFKRILLVPESLGMKRFLSESLHDLYSEQLDLVVARDAKTALGKIEEGGIELVIVERHVPEVQGLSPDPNRSSGLELLQACRKRGWDMPVIFLGEFDNAIHRAIKKLPPSEFLVSSGLPDLEEDLRNAIDQLATRSPGKVEPQPVFFEVNLESNANQTYSVRRCVNQKPVESDKKALSIRWSQLRDIRDMTEDLDLSRKNWETHLRNYGTQILEILLAGSQEFKNEFTTSFDDQESQGRVHIRFNVDPDIYGVPFEALYKGDRFLMLETPISRKVRKTPSRPLLRFDGSERILFIESNVHRGQYINVHELEWAPEPLANLEDEREYFEQLQKGRRRRMTGDIKILRTDDEIPLVERVEEALTEGGRYDIVHFAGHSHFTDDGEGLLLFGGEPPELIGIPEFASWLKKAETRLVFLSSCRSSEASAAFELARNDVPAIIGFRWNLEDEYAAKFAKAFYERLFKCRHIDEAFVHTRFKMHSSYKNHRIWAAPVLVLEDDESNGAMTRAA